MSPERIAAKLADAISRLDQIAGWVEGDDSSAISCVASDLADLKRALERETFRQAVAA